ncbi:MAG: hypothetical protein LBD58_02405 [Treponema sp.]|nr:hypothetical protein [Treponema sp.]
MIRIEIIANHSVEENILEAFQHEKAAAHYTRFPGVFGIGASGPRMGDAVWPEENFVIVVWCEEAEAERIERAVASVKKYFPDEGIKLFKMSDAPRQHVVYLPTPVTPPAGTAAGTEGNSDAGTPESPSKPKRTYAGPEGENR